MGLQWPLHRKNEAETSRWENLTFLSPSKTRIHTSYCWSYQSQGAKYKMRLFWNSRVRKRWLPLQDKRNIVYTGTWPNPKYSSNQWQVVTLLIYHCYFKSRLDLSLFLLYLNSFSKNDGCFWKCMLQKSDYFKCIASQCLSPPHVLSFLRDFDRQRTRVSLLL